MADKCVIIGVKLLKEMDKYVRSHYGKVRDVTDVVENRFWDKLLLRSR